MCTTTINAPEKQSSDVAVTIILMIFFLLQSSSLRCVGVLLGSSAKGTIDVTNSFAVPFEEDAKNPSIFFLDHNYLDTMFKMHKKVNGGFCRTPCP